LSTEVSISFLFIPIFSARLHQPFRVTRLKRLGRPSCLARLFYIPETLLLFGFLVLGLLLWEGVRWLHRKFRSSAATAQAAFWKNPKQKDKKFRCALGVNILTNILLLMTPRSPVHS